MDWHIDGLLDDVDIPEFFPELDSLNACRRILSHREANCIRNAALFAHANRHEAAERCRVQAGYGNLGTD